MSRRKSIKQLIDDGTKVYIGWKVIRTDNRVSLMCPVLNCGGKTYLKGRWIRRDKDLGGLLIFPKKTDAVRFSGGCYDLRIVVRCEYIRTKSHKFTAAWDDLEFLKKAAKRKGIISGWPIGTGFAEAVRCLE